MNNERVERWIRERFLACDEMGPDAIDVARLAMEFRTTKALERLADAAEKVVALIEEEAHTQNA